MSKARYVAFVDARLDRAERALDAAADHGATVPGLEDWLAAEQVDAAEAYAAHAATGPLEGHPESHVPEPQGRVVHVGRKVYVCRGHVSSRERAQQFGRDTEADEYGVLDGAPVGRPESLQGARRESQAAASDAYWAARIAARDAGLTKSQRRRARRGR